MSKEATFGECLLALSKRTESAESGAALFEYIKPILADAAFQGLQQAKVPMDWAMGDSLASSQLVQVAAKNGIAVCREGSGLLLSWKEDHIAIIKGAFSEEEDPTAPGVSAPEELPKPTKRRSRRKKTENSE